MQNYIVGLDIGSHTIKAAVGEIKRDKQLTLIAAISGPSVGIRKGVVSDVGDLTQALSPIFLEIKRISKNALKNIFLGVGSSDLKVQPSIGVVAVSRADYEIYHDDVSRAIQSAQAINVHPNRMVIHSVVRDFVVDGVREIRDPLGMIGNRLEVNSLIIDGFAPAIKSLTKCVEILGGSVSGLILAPLADARAVLSKDQKELGVMLIDIGFGKTSICVYEESKLIHTAVFPVGSGNITNDLAIGLKIFPETAETIKLSFGTALAREVGARDSVELAKIDQRVRGNVSRKFIADIIEVRLAEIFELINNELKYIGKAGNLPGGVVMVGGGVKLPGMADLARLELKLSTQIGNADLSGVDLQNETSGLNLEDPACIQALGLLFWGYDKALESKPYRFSIGGIWRRLFHYFTP